jgi:hypothetical protein
MLFDDTKLQASAMVPLPQPSSAATTTARPPKRPNLLPTAWSASLPQRSSPSIAHRIWGRRVGRGHRNPSCVVVFFFVFDELLTGTLGGSSPSPVQERARVCGEHRREEERQQRKEKTLGGGECKEGMGHALSHRANRRVLFVIPKRIACKKKRICQMAKCISWL